MFFLVWDLVMVATTALAFWRGQSEERIAAVSILVLTAINPFVQLKTFGPRGVEWFGAVGDIFFLAMFGYFAIVRRLWWAVFAAGFQSLAIFIHAARLADIQIGRAAYAAAYGKYSYLVLAALLFGIWSRRRLPAPSSSSPPAAPRSPW